MTKKIFENLSEKEQIKFVRTRGAFLAERCINGNRVFLFAIGSFYVELIYELSNIENNPLSVYRVFFDTSYLDEYVDQIDISELNLS